MSQIISSETQRVHNGNSVGDEAKNTGGLHALYQPVADQLEVVESILRDNLTSDTPWVDQLLEHSWLLGGKRMRPVLLLLAGLSVQQNPDLSHGGSQQTGQKSAAQAMEFMAAALEMIHTATLVHDDVIDEADVRRHEPTANSKWGNKVSVLLGDYLFTHAFYVGAQAKSVEALSMLAAASNKVCAGEMKQNYYVGKFEINEAIYYEIVSEKTAELCAVGCAIGALLAGAAPSLVSRYESYGRDLGIAFQVIDDILDLVGNQATVGKTLGTDLVNQKPTLPVIHGLQTIPAKDRAVFLDQLKTGNLGEILATLETTGSIAYARDAARQHIQRAADFAESLPTGSASKALQDIAQFVLKRSH